MHWNYPDFKEIYTAHFSNLASMLLLFDVSSLMKKIWVNLEIFEFFGTQTIEGSRQFQSLPWTFCEKIPIVGWFTHSFHLSIDENVKFPLQYF
jgi:hypothetical protein